VTWLFRAILESESPLITVAKPAIEKGRFEMTQKSTRLRNFCRIGDRHSISSELE